MENTNSKIIYDTTNESELNKLSLEVNISKEKLEKILQRANENKSKSYSPYSKFRVASVLYTSDEKEYDGVNVENLSYGLSICAERSAIVSAISQGCKPESFYLFVVTTDREEFITPCGACRQFISEYKNLKWVIANNSKGKSLLFKSEELLPYCFDCIL